MNATSFIGTVAKYARDGSPSWMGFQVILGGNFLDEADKDADDSMLENEDAV